MEKVQSLTIVFSQKPECSVSLGRFLSLFHKDLMLLLTSLTCLLTFTHKNFCRREFAKAGFHKSAQAGQQEKSQLFYDNYLKLWIP